MKLLPAIALTVAGIYILSKLSTAGVASRLNLFISSFSLSVTGLFPVISVGVTAQNVTDNSLQFSALVANALLNGTMIGNVSGFTPVTIPPKGQTVIPLNIQVNATEVISDVVSILSGSAQVSANLEITGTANISDLLLPIDLIYKAV